MRRPRLAATFLVCWLFGTGDLCAAPVRPYPMDPSLNRVELILDAPQIIAQAPAEERRWGRFQFPTISRLRDGRLLIQFSAKEDSVRGYSHKSEYPNRAVSSDDGKTWTLAERVGGHGGLGLPDGSRIMFPFKGSCPASELSLPESVGTQPGSYNKPRVYYRADQLSPEIRDCFVRKFLPPGADQWETSKASVDIPGQLFESAGGYFAFQGFLQMETTPWGTLMATVFPACPRWVDAKIEDKVDVTLLESTDTGQTWRAVGRIPFRADAEADPFAANRRRLYEPEFAFTPDGTMMCLLRSTDGAGVGPLYQAHSSDCGRTWTQPEVLDRLGVRPRLVVLRNGVTLGAYGRPGLYLRATADPAARQWDAPVTLVPPAETLNEDTCGYADLLAVGPDEALVVYSHFTWPGPDATPRKTILLQRVRARPRTNTPQ